MFSVPLIIPLLFCTAAEKERGNKEEMVTEVSQHIERTVHASFIIVPEGYEIKAMVEGLTYAVDITFDKDGNYYIAEVDGPAYGTRPPRAPEARILKAAPNLKSEVFYDRIVPPPLHKDNQQHETEKN